MFSELVDSVLTSTGRQSALSRSDATRYLNMTIRECSNLEYFFADSKEQRIDIVDGDPQFNGSNAYQWDRPALFRIMRTVQLIDAHHQKMSVPFIQPGRKQKNEDLYRYFGPTYMMIVGVGVNSTMNMYWYEWPKQLVYYESAARPAKYDKENGTWSYLQPDGSYGPSLPTSEEEETARLKVSNWLLERWEPTIEQGTLAKLFNVKGEEDKQRLAFNLFSGNKKELRTQEPYDDLDT